MRGVLVTQAFAARTRAHNRNCTATSANRAPRCDNRPSGSKPAKKLVKRNSSATAEATTSKASGSIDALVYYCDPYSGTCAAWSPQEGPLELDAADVYAGEDEYEMDALMPRVVSIHTDGNNGGLTLADESVSFEEFASAEHTSARMDSWEETSEQSKGGSGEADSTPDQTYNFMASFGNVGVGAAHLMIMAHGDEPESLDYEI